VPGTPNPAVNFPIQHKLAAGAFNVNSNTGFKNLKDGATTTFLMGEASGGGSILAGGPNLLGLQEPTQVDQSLRSVDQAWAQGYIGTDGKGGFGAIFAATALNATYNPATNLSMNEPRSGGDGSSVTANWTPLKMNMSGLKFIKVTSIDDSYPNGSQAAPSSDMSTSSGSPFRSFHRGICHFLFGDGSVRSVTENLDSRLYVGMSSLHGRELIPEEHQ
jgi:hypothetical protein